MAKSASQQTRTAGYLDGMTLGNPSFFVKHLAGQDLADYYDGFREGIKNFYRNEPWVPKMSARDTWDDEMAFEARGPVPDEALPHMPGWGRPLAPHASPASSPHNPRSVTNVHATEFSRLPQEEQDRQLAKVHGHAPEGVDLSHEGIVNRLIGLHHSYAHGDEPTGKLFDTEKSRSQRYHEGGNFYHEANDWAKNQANHPNLVGGQQKRRRAAAGILSALSPGTEWENNKAQAEHFIENHHKYAHLDPWTAAQRYHKTLTDARGQGFTRNTQGNYYKAFHMARGGEPDDHLGGHKVRSFFNAVIDPKNKSGRNDVVMDRHAVSAAVGGTMDEGRLNSLFYGYRHKDPETGEISRPAMGSSKKHNTIGTYAHFADAYREAHRRLTESGEDAGAHPAEFQAKVWGVWRDEAANNHKKVVNNRNMPHYAQGGPSEEPEAINDFGDPIDTWGGPDDEPDPDLDPEGHTEYWRTHHQDGSHTAARTNRSTGDTSGDFGTTPEITQQGYDPDPSKDETAKAQEGLGGVFGSMMPHHLGTDMDEWAFMVEATLAYEPEPALPWTDAGEPEGVTHQDTARMDNIADSPYSSQTMAALHEADLNNLQQNAPGHQAQPGMYREDAEGDADPSEWWQQQHSTSADNPVSTGPETFGNPTDPGYYPLMHGQEEPDERLLDPTGKPLTSTNFGANFEFNGGYQDPGLDPSARFAAAAQAYEGVLYQWGGGEPQADTAESLSRIAGLAGHRPIAAASPFVPAAMQPDPYARVEEPMVRQANMEPVIPSSGSRDWLRPSGGASPPPPAATAETTAGSQRTGRSSRMESYIPDEGMSGVVPDLPPGVALPHWLMSGGASGRQAGAGGPGRGYQGSARNPSEGDIAKAARAHLASLSISEQQDLINEGADTGARASNYDRLRLGGTHYMALEAQLAAAEEDAESLFL